MDVLYERCCGLDVHKDKIVACVLEEKHKSIRSFGTVTDDLLTLVEWLKETHCECVAMESTGSYWKPIYNLLELENIKALVVNAQHIKTVPGRKTDVKDAEWIANLLRHGLLKASFIPNRDQRELRELVRYRKSIIEERAREFNRIQKVLEGANIKLGSVASTIKTISARDILKSLSNGEEDPEVLASLARGVMKNKREELCRALKGLMAEHQRMILDEMLKHTEYLDDQIVRLDQEVAKRLTPFDQAVEVIDSIPGIGRRSAETIIAEIGTDMSVFSSAKHLASWAGMCPGNNESAGKQKSSRIRKGNQTLRTTLVECAKAASRKKGCSFQDQYHRISARRGKKRAIVAVGHSLLIVIYHLLRDGTTYQELGPVYLERLNKASYVKRTVKKLEKLGLKVTIEEVA